MYETVDISDTNIRVLTEEQIDKEFPAKTVWEQFFLKGNDDPQLVLKQENPEGEYYKVGGKFKIGSDDLGDDTHSMIYLIDQHVFNNELRSQKRAIRVDVCKTADELEISKRVIREIMHLSQYTSGDSFVRTFTYCKPKCYGFVEGHYVSEKYNDIGFLAGSSGIKHNCRRCGSQLGVDIFARS